MRDKLTFWFEFASTYSFLSAMRLEDEAQAAGVEVEWKPFLLGPIFKAQGMDNSPFNLFPVKGKNMWRDVERLAMKYGLGDLTFPTPFPQIGVLAARVFLIGKSERWQNDFARAVFSAEFREGKNIGDEAVIRDILARLSLDAETLVARAQNDTEIKNELRKNTEEAGALGLFGAPSFVTTDDELFWGNDRLEDALIWQKRLNLKEKS